MKKKSKIILFFLSLLAVLVYLPFGLNLVTAAPTKSEKNIVDKPVDQPKVFLHEIQPQKDENRVLIPVKVESKVQSLVSADIEGNVVRILKPLGSVVHSGEVVLYIENQDPGFTYAPVPIKSPVSGVLSQIWISQMTKVQRGDRLFTVIDPKKIKLTGEVPSREIFALKNGLQGKFVSSLFSEEALVIKVTGISPIVDPRTGTASAEFEFSSKRALGKDKVTQKNKKDFYPSVGSLGQAEFVLSRGEILIVPELAVIYRDGKPMVRVLVGKDQYEKKPIDLGEQRDSYYVIKSGLGKGDRVIVRSSRPLKEGEKIEVEEVKN